MLELDSNLIIQKAERDKIKQSFSELEKNALCSGQIFNAFWAHVKVV